MGDLKFVKLATNLFENEKIKQIISQKNGDKNIIIWVRILCLGGKCNFHGLLTLDGVTPYDAKMIATSFALPVKTVEIAISMFFEHSMLEEINGFISICNWDKYQSADKLDQIRKKNAEKMRVYRQEKKAITLPNGNGDGNHNSNGYGNGNGNGHVTKHSALTRIAGENKRDTDNISPKGGEKYATPTPPGQPFKAPSLEEIKTFCKTNQIKYVIPERFFAVFDSQNWIQKNGKPIEDWMGRIRLWEAEEEAKRKPANGTVSKKPDIHVDWLEEYLASNGEAPRS